MECPALQIFKNLTGHDPEQPPPGESTLNKGLDWRISKVPFHPSGSVILRNDTACLKELTGMSPQWLSIVFNSNVYNELLRHLFFLPTTLLNPESLHHPFALCLLKRFCLQATKIKKITTSKTI